MNESCVEQVSAEKEGSLDAVVPAAFMTGVQKEWETFERIATGMGQDMDRLVQEAEVPLYILKSEDGKKLQEAARLQFTFETGIGSVNRIGLWAGKDSEMTVLMDYASAKREGGKGIAAIQTRVFAESGSRIRLVQVQRLGAGTDCLNDLGVLCEEGAQVEVLQLVLGGGSTYLGCKAQLSGEMSGFGADIGYLLRDEQRLDMNYVTLHEGKRTKSKIIASGALRDQAFKLFRGTIDFQTGSSGAEGEEKEEVLLLDDTVVNRTIPLILCGEEDVQGNHGATIGRLDGELLFYLEARGICREEIYEMMARARVEALCAKIPDAETRNKVEAWLEGGTGNED